MKKQKTIIITKPDNWDEIISDYKQFPPSITEAREIVNKYWPKSNEWRTGKLQLVRNVFMQQWQNVKVTYQGKL